MSTEHKVITDQDEWTSLLLAAGNPHVLQSWEWGEVKEAYGWKAERVLFLRDGEPLAAVSILVRRLRPLPLRFAYAPKGPVLLRGREGDLAEALGMLQDYAAARKWSYCKIDPDLPLADWPDGPPFPRPGHCKGEEIQFRNTAILDIGADEGTILAAMKPKWRYNIRLGEKKGLLLRSSASGDPADEDHRAFYSLYRETGRRDGFFVRSADYYRTVWRILEDRGMGRVFVASFEDRDIGGIYAFLYGKTAWYFYGASSSSHRKLMPNHALQWEAIKWAKERGAATYDMWGAPDKLDEGESMWGVWRFKEGFGARFAEQTGAYDLYSSKAAYRLAVGLPKAATAVMKRLRRR